MKAVLRFADGDVEHHELADRLRYDAHVTVERDNRQLTLYRTRQTHDGRPVFEEEPSAATIRT